MCFEYMRHGRPTLATAGLLVIMFPHFASSVSCIAAAVAAADDDEACMEL